MAKFTDSIPGSILKVRLITIAFESSLVEMKTLSFFKTGGYSTKPLLHKCL